VYFISRSGKSSHILYDRMRKEFRLTCVPPCGQVACFHRGMLKPYSVSAGTLERGYADIAGVSSDGRNSGDHQTEAALNEGIELNSFGSKFVPLKDVLLSEPAPRVRSASTRD